VKESQRSPLQRYRSRLRQVFSQIGETVVRLEEVPDAILQKNLKENIDLAGKLQKKIADLSSKGESVSSQPSQDVNKILSTFSSVSPVSKKDILSPHLSEKKADRIPISNKQKSLLNVKKELKSLYQFVSSRANQNNDLSLTSTEETIVCKSERTLPDRRLYREELEGLDSFEKLQLNQLIEDLDSPSPQSRSLAVEKLGEKNLKAINPILLKKWLEEIVPEIQFKIISILTRQNYTPLIPAARKILEENKTNWALSAMEALYRLDCHSNLVYLQQALTSKVSAIKKRAVTYIGWIKDHSSIPELIRLLRDPDSYVRKSAVSALASLKVKRSVHFLIEVLMDPDPGVRSYAFKTLRKLIGETFDYNPETNYIKRKESVERLNIWWESVESEFSLDKKSKSSSKPHLFSMMLTSNSGQDSLIEEKILSAVAMSEDGADLLEIGERIGVPWQRLVIKVEQLRREGKLEKTARKFTLVHDPRQQSF
jgi:HEAT repeat protein